MEAVKNLYPVSVDVKSRDFDWTEGYPETWEYTEAETCSECDKILVNRGGEEQHCDLDDESTCEGPMMNYFYPLPDAPDDEVEAAKLIVDLPLCLVYFTKTDEWGLALTGGGMNLSWEICEAFMRFGYLPPLDYCDLPDMAGKSFNERNKWILAGCARSAQFAKVEANSVAARISRLRKTMKEKESAHNTPRH